MPRGHYLTEAVKDAIWVLRAEGVSEAEIGRRLGLAKRTVSKYLERVGGVRPRAGRRPERCLTSLRPTAFARQRPGRDETIRNVRGGALTG
jgi:hypothetical protein